MAGLVLVTAGLGRACAFPQNGGVKSLGKVAFGVLAICLPAGANTLGPFSGGSGSTAWNASAFNIVTLLGGLTSSSDIGGGVAVNGNLNTSSAPVDSSPLGNPYTDQYGLIVNGNITNGGGMTFGSGSAGQAWIKGTYPAFNAPAPTVSTSPSSLDFSFATAATSLDQLAGTTLPGATGATTLTFGNSNGNFVIAPSGAGVFVYNVAYTYLTQSNQALEVDLTSTTTQTVIVNVTGAPPGGNLTSSTGTVVKINGSNEGETQGGVPVLFNFENLSGTLSVTSGTIDGTYLAPQATFNTGDSVNGQLFVGSVTGTGEVHDDFFNGSLPTATPEPAAMSMCAGGLLLAWGSLFRLRRGFPAPPGDEVA